MREVRGRVGGNAATDGCVSSPLAAWAAVAGAAPAQRRCDRRAPAALVTWAALAGTDLLDWIALRRVSDGGVTNLDGCWLDGGRRVPGYVTETLGELLAAGLIVLADQQSGGMRRSTLTDCGAARYQRLAQQRQAVPDDVISGRPRVEPFPASAPRGRPVPHEQSDGTHPSR